MPLRNLALFLAFFVMGFGDARGSFVGISKESFGISAAQGSLIPFFGALAFGVFALPAGLLAARKGKRFVLQLGLLITAAGHALPWLLLTHYYHLLAGVFLIGVGMTCLLVAGNPLMRDVAGPERFARTLTFAQFVKSLGSIAGPYFIAFIVCAGLSWRVIFPAFTLVALAACALGGFLGLIGLMLGSRALAIASVILCGLSFANIWPTLFTLILDARPDRGAEVAGLSVLANIGGAVLPFLMGAVADVSALRWSFLVPLAAFTYLAGLGLAQFKSGTA